MLTFGLCDLWTLYRADGGELFERVKDGKFPEHTAKLFFYQLLMAIKVRR